MKSQFDAGNNAAGEGAAPAKGVQVLGTTESQAAMPSHFEPGNLLADAGGHVYASNVNPLDELVNILDACSKPVAAPT